MESFGITIGEREVWANKIPFGLLPHDRTRHLYIIGQTGTGKSNLLGELVRQDIEAGEGIALIDPHGDLADQIFDHIPRSRIDDVIVIDTDDREHPIAINPFYRVPKDEQSLVAANLVSTMKHTWSDSWGPRLQYILGNATRTVIAAPMRRIGTQYGGA
jgi:DNA helicase HerA-like ATPase